MTDATVIDERPALPALRTGKLAGGIVPTTIEEVFRLATAIQKSGLAPNNMKTPEAITVAIMHGLEIGLMPMQAIQKIAVINGRPSIWGDALPALLWARGFKIEETASPSAATCTVIRPDGTVVTRTFTEGDAKKAGLWGKTGPWTQYPTRMLQMRARSFAARDGAADALSGLYVMEEVEDMKDITPKKSSYAAKKDGTDKRFEEIRKRLAEAVTEEDVRQVKDEFAQEWAEMPRAWGEILDHEYDDKLQGFMSQLEAAE